MMVPPCKDDGATNYHSMHSYISYTNMTRLVVWTLLLLSCCCSIHAVDPSRSGSRARRNRRSPPSNNDASSLLSPDDLTVAGQLLPAVKKFSLSSTNILKVVDALKEAIDVKEFALIGVLGFGTVPLVKAMHNVYVRVKKQWSKRRKSSESTTIEEEDNEQEESPSLSSTRAFEDTYFYRSVLDISHVAQIGALVFGVDCFMVTLNALGFTSIASTKTGLSKKVAQISYTIWAGLRLSRLKHYLLRKKLRHNPNALVKTRLYNRILNTCIGIITGAIVFDCLNLNFGTALKSLLSFGGVGALVLSLSSKDVATQLVSGITLSTGDRFLEGDEIQLGDGQAGIIEKMGLAYTDLRGYDEITTRIPNSQLSQQRVRNLSRVSKSQVTQTLWFSYDDIDTMPVIMQAIKDQVNASACGEYLITDGSRPFRAHWRNFEKDHLEVVVDFHFNIKAATQHYWDNRQVVLEAIASAVKKLGVEFTFPTSIKVSRNEHDKHGGKNNKKNDNVDSEESSSSTMAKLVHS